MTATANNPAQTWKPTAPTAATTTSGRVTFARSANTGIRRSPMVGRRSIRLDLQRFSRDNNSEPEPEMKDMTPVAFPQVNVTYQPPSGATDVAPLPAYRDGSYAISCWSVPLVARIALLFSGRVWFTAMAAEHPPVKLSVTVPFSTAPQPPQVAP